VLKLDNTLKVIWRWGWAVARTFGLPAVWTAFTRHRLLSAG
jgi:hypothetical protein